MVVTLTAPAETLQHRIVELGDGEAITVLRQVLRYQHRLPTREETAALVAHLIEASDRPVVLDRPVSPALGGPVGPGSCCGPDDLRLPLDAGPVRPGDLARETLLYLLVERPVLEPVLAAALTQTRAPQPPGGHREGPHLGVLVLLAVRDQVTLEHDEQGRWQLRVHRRASCSGQLAGVLTRLLAAAGHLGA